MNQKLTSSCALSVLLIALLSSLSGCEKGHEALMLVKDKFAAFAVDKPEAGAKDEGHDEAEHAEPEGEGKAGHQEASGHDEHGEGEVLRLSAAQVIAAGIKTETIEPQITSEQIAVTGTIKANQDRLAHVQARLPGRVVAVTAKLGDQVTEGQTLARLDSVELNEAATAYLQIRSELSLGEANFKRANKLYADKIIPQKDYLSARAEVEKARNAQRAAASKLELFDIDPAQVGDHNSALVFPLISPFGGTVIEKHIVLGEFADPGKSLFTIADLSILWIETSIFDKDLSKIKPGLAATVSVAAYPEEIFTGSTTYIGSMVDEETRTVSARVELANTDNRLKVGMFANVLIESGAGAAALTVPDEAVMLIKGESTVFVAEHGGFEPRTVVTGKRAGGRVILESGIKPGESVVVSGAYNLKSRMLKSELGEGHAH